MTVKRLTIKRQIDDSFAIVAKVEHSDGSLIDIPVQSAKTPRQLQTAFHLYVHDKEALQTDIQYHMLAVV